MYKAIILPAAREDIRDAAIWYNKQQADLGKKFIAEVRDMVLHIQRNPKASNVRYGNISTAVLSVFPFMVHYSIEENKKTIIVAAVLHTSRDPKLWEGRQ
jgi:plasmid stabilization system protein ParE